MPKAAEPLVREFAGAFSRLTYVRFAVLCLAAILTAGRRTISNPLRTVHIPALGRPSTYHRVLPDDVGRRGDWPGKTDQTFSDAIPAVRRWLWVDWVSAAPRHHDALARLSGPTRAVPLYALAPAA